MPRSTEIVAITRYTELKPMQHHDASPSDSLSNLETIRPPTIEDWHQLRQEALQATADLSQEMTRLKQLLGRLNQR